MTSRDLDRLAKRVKAHRLELYPSRLAAAQAAGISKDTWKRVEEGKPVLDVKYAQIDKALGWSTGSCVAIAEGGEPILVDRPHGGVPVPAPAVPASAEVVRQAAFEAARSKLPTAPIGDVDAFSDELVEVLRKAGYVTDAD